MNVGMFLNKIRLERGLSLRVVSSAVGIAYSSLCEYEKGLSDPPTSKFLKLCDFYNVKLFGLSDNDTELIYYGDFSEESKKKIKAIIRFEMELGIEKKE